MFYALLYTFCLKYCLIFVLTRKMRGDLLWFLLYIFDFCCFLCFLVSFFAYRFLFWISMLSLLSLFYWLQLMLKFMLSGYISFCIPFFIWFNGVVGALSVKVLVGKRESIGKGEKKGEKGGFFTCMFYSNSLVVPF